MEKHLPTILVFAGFVMGLMLVSLASRFVRPNRGSNRIQESIEQTPVRQSLHFEPILCLSAIFFLGFLLLFPAAASLKNRLGDIGHRSQVVAMVLFLSVLSIGLIHARKRGAQKNNHGNL